MWRIDSTVETLYEFLPPMAGIVMGGKFNEEGHATYVATCEKVADFIHKTLHSHKGHWLADDKITNADFVAAAWLWSFVFNTHFPNQEWTKQA